MTDKPEYRQFRVISTEGERETFEIKVPSEEELEAIMRPKELKDSLDSLDGQQATKQLTRERQKAVQPTNTSQFSEGFMAIIARFSAGQVAIILLIVAFNLSVIFVSLFGIVPWISTLGQFGKAASWLSLILIDLGLLVGASWPLVDWKFRVEFQERCEELRKVRILEDKFLCVDGVSYREARERYDAEIDRRYKQCRNLYFFYKSKGIDYRGNHDFSDKNYLGWFAVAVAVGFGAISYFAAGLPLGIAIFLWFTWLPLAIIGWLWEMVIDNIKISSCDF